MKINPGGVSGMVPDRGHGGHWSVVAAAVGCLIAWASAVAEPQGNGVSANPNQKPQADQPSANPPASIQPVFPRCCGLQLTYCAGSAIKIRDIAVVGWAGHGGRDG